MFCWIGISTAIINNPHKDLINSSGMITTFLIVKSRSFPLSRRRHCRPIAAVFTPIATKEFEYRRFWWNGALRNLIVERRWESDLTYLHFSRGVGSAPQTLFAVFYYFPAPPSSSSPSPPPALCSPLFLSLSLSLTSQRNITTISIPVDIAGR